MRHEPLPMCNLLPMDARTALIVASRKPDGQRQRAIEDATRWIKRKYPQFFRTEKEPKP